MNLVDSSSSAMVQAVRDISLCIHVIVHVVIFLHLQIVIMLVPYFLYVSIDVLLIWANNGCILGFR